MVRMSVPRVVTAVVGGFLATALIYVLLLVADGGPGTPHGNVLGLGLLVPAIAGAMVGALSWLLLSDGDRTERPRRATCAACGSPVMKDWRLCPHCGRFVNDDAQRPEDAQQS